VVLVTDNMSTAGIPGPRFLNYCEHLPVYSGAVRNAAARIDEQEEQEAETVAALMLDPDLEVSRG
jgi:hypothetical protein